MDKTESSFTANLLQQMSLFSFISKILAHKYKRISYLISFIYLIILMKIRPKSLRIKPLDKKHFADIIAQNSFSLNLIGDVQDCALLSINTLVALSLTSTSWIKISKSSCEEENISEKGRKPWKIKLPDVKKNVQDFYYVQCICVSNAPQDFIIYVTDKKLFNISKFQKGCDEYCELVKNVAIEGVEFSFLPKFAKSAVLAPISSQYNVDAKDMKLILSKYFEKARLLRIGDVFEINAKDYLILLESKNVLCKIQNLSFKVIHLKGAVNGDKSQEYFIARDFTSLYLKAPIAHYLLPKNNLYIKSSDSNDEAYISHCPEGLHKYYNKMREVFMPFIKLNVTKPRPMFLLCGAAGSGKKVILKLTADSFGLNFIQENAFDYQHDMNPSLFKGKLEQLFGKIKKSLPCVLYWENIQLIGRDQDFKENDRLVDIFECHINKLFTGNYSHPVILVASAADSEIVPAIERLFIFTIKFEAPKFEDTFKTLNWLLKKNRLRCSSTDVRELAEKVRGYVYADLVLLVEHALRFKFRSLGDDILMDHFKKAIEVMEAAYSDSIGAAKVPTVRWEDVGGLADLKEEIMLTLNLPLKHPELFSSGLKRSGILFYGPPGTGKTLLAKAIATECNYNFLSVKGPELMNMYVGQSEKNVREVFERGREAAPCIIFFDEFDSLAPSRGKSGDSGGVTDRIVSQLLAEMDGLDRNKDLFVLAATNRPDLVDPALLRPGRFDKMFYVGICTDKKSKMNVLQALTRKFSLSGDVNFEEIIESLPAEVTGADLYSLSSNAWFSAARKAIAEIEKGVKVPLPLTVDSSDFEVAVTQFVPSLSAEDIIYYEKLKLSGGR